MYVNSGNNDRLSGFYKRLEVNHWGGTQWARPLLFWVKKEEIAE